MRKFVLSICAMVLWAITLFHLTFLCLFTRNYRKEKRELPLLMGLVTLGLFYDAFVISIGAFVSEGTALKVFSKFRYISHGALIPLLLVISETALGFGKKGKIAAWAITGILMILGAVSGVETETMPKSVDGVIRYVEDSDLTPKWAHTILMSFAFGTVIPLMVSGIVVWVKEHTPFLFLSGLLMFIFAGAGGAVGGPYIFVLSMIGEVFMVLFFYLYDRFKAKKDN